MRVEAGMTLNELTAAAAARGLALPATVRTLPSYAGLTLGGIFSVTAHDGRAASTLVESVVEVVSFSSLLFFFRDGLVGLSRALVWLTR